MIVRKILFAPIVLGLAVGANAAEMRFWNLTSVTIDELQLAPAGTEKWGANQCDNDPDKSVDGDERLKLVGITPGKYDVKIHDTSGRRCLVKNVDVKADGKYAFSIGESDLKDCQK